MRQIETIATGKNFSAVSVGKMNEIIEHVLPMGPERTAVSCTPTRRMRNCISSSKVRGSTKWTARFSPSARAPSSAWLPTASVR